jgi:hypothetical protein
MLAFTLGDSARSQGSCTELPERARMSNIASISFELESTAIAEAEAIKPEMATRVKSAEGFSRFE